VQPASNIPDFTVSELSGAIKRAVESGFGYVRVRGEVSGWRGPHSSGHAYFRLKDDKAVIEAVCWKGALGKLGCKLEEGLEIIATGKITTYPGSSKYQIVIDRAEPAGIGALMAQLERLKQKLAAEGLFDASRKKPLPFLPEVIGIVTSPTGAVIRDILHRLSDRFPLHVLLWPVAVQGQGAAEQIAAAIRGFNELPASGFQLPALKADSRQLKAESFSPIRPDLLIVARGGGSLEDLWAFNEEIVARAVAASTIPVISGVGHETDTTLIDFVADLRAPTPTGAAEMAVPVRDELLLWVREQEQRTLRGMMQRLQTGADRVTGLSRGLPNPRQLLEHATQRLDVATERLEAALPSLLHKKEQRLAALTAGLTSPKALLAHAQQRFENVAARMQTALGNLLQSRAQQLNAASGKLNPALMLQGITRHEADMQAYAQRMQRLWQRHLQDKAKQVEQASRLLDTMDFRKVLSRGYALVRDEAGRVVKDAALIATGQVYQVQFAEGEADMQRTEPAARKPAKKEPAQGQLF
jgi:exodeoxyribonuclease VII large subunit